MILDSVGIQKILPHRYPFLMVDTIEEMEPKKRIDRKSVVLGNTLYLGGGPFI